MSTERPDQYPEVSGEEAGIVPPQGAAKQEWPKKIRTLTANELDRLTIDGLGRFYWDGKLVNYEAHPSRLEKPIDLDQHAMELLERTARELDPNTPSAAETIVTDAPVVEAPVVETLVTEVQSHAAVSSEAPALAATPADQLSPVTPAEPMTTPAPVVEVRRQEVMVPMGQPDTAHVKLTGLQSLALFVATVSFLIAAVGMAASGFVALHDWGCKNGAYQRGCAPPPAAPKPPARPEIPA